MHDVDRWIADVIALTGATDAVWIDGSAAQERELLGEAVRTGELTELDPLALPGCYLHRTSQADGARAETSTFISTPDRESVGPCNNWLSPSDADVRISRAFKGAMRGRRVYAVPFLLGSPSDGTARAGIQLTDSRYVVLCLLLLTRVTTEALAGDSSRGPFVRCVHSTGTAGGPRMLVHLPLADSVWSIGSAYGGDAVLAKKAVGLRLASGWARRDGWLAEHMSVLGVEDPAGRVRYLACAGPSGSGKTNLAMLQPPAAMTGWKTWMVSDDLTWLQPRSDGRLWASNPEAGVFARLPEVNSRTNPLARRAIEADTIYTNVALRPDGRPWWEGHDDPPPLNAYDWRGEHWSPASGQLAAHRNARFTTRLARFDMQHESGPRPDAVPIDAILLTVRRAHRVPLVVESFDWEHGVYLGAGMGSETTAAGSAREGQVRRDPMGMRAFCSYHMADYLAHWLAIGRALRQAPQIFAVNWFRTHGPENEFAWPGFGDNFHVLRWILGRLDGGGAGVDTAIGTVPPAATLHRPDSPLSERALQAILRVDPLEWSRELGEQEAFFRELGARFPPALWRQHGRTSRRIGAQAIATGHEVNPGIADSVPAAHD